MVTILLVTQPSRLKYFEDCIASVASALATYPWLELLLVVNGRSPKANELGETLRDKFPERVSIEVFEENTNLGDSVWEVLHRRGTTWVNFLGDDDLLLLDNLEFVHKSIQQDPQLTAIGFSALAINTNGSLTGKVLMPLPTKRVERGKLIAQSLHQPPFVWPALVFNFRGMPKEPFLSRFVSDWWVGLNIIKAGNFITTEKPLIMYRIHDSQESSLALENRKRLEAQIMMHFVLDSGFLNDILQSQTQQKFLLSAIKDFLPIYSDARFGVPILLRILNSFKNKGVDIDRLTLFFISEYASTNGVIMNMSEFPRRNGVRIPHAKVLNTNIVWDTSLCDNLKQALSNFEMQSFFPPIHLYCLHSQRSYTTTSFFLDCEKFQNRSKEFIATSILRDISQSMSQTLSLSARERKLLLLFKQFVILYRRFILFFPLRLN